MVWLDNPCTLGIIHGFDCLFDGLFVYACPHFMSIIAKYRVL